MTAPRYSTGMRMRGGQQRLVDVVECGWRRAGRSGCRSRSSAVGERGAVGDRRRGRDQREAELALEALAHDLHVQEAEEAAAEAEAERVGALGLEGDAGVVELQLVERVAQQGQLVAVDRVQPAEDHRLGVPVALERLGRGRARVGDRLAAPRLADVLDPRDQVPDLAGAERVGGDGHRGAAPHSSTSWTERAWRKRSLVPVRSVPSTTRIGSRRRGTGRRTSRR